MDGSTIANGKVDGGELVLPLADPDDLFNPPRILGQQRPEIQEACGIDKHDTVVWGRLTEFRFCEPTGPRILLVHRVSSTFCHARTRE